MLLPVAQRELQVAARKPATFRIRVAGAGTALIVGAAFLLASSAGLAPNASSIGRPVFSVLTWLCLAVVLSAGLFLTSDALSQEKREGTLGFLFLTNLRGYDVALGKLSATSLRGFSAVLAVFPVLAITLLTGGVSAGVFWRTSLALVNALVLSLCAGLFVSAISRDSQKALAGTLLLLLGFVAAGPIADLVASAVRATGFIPRLSLSSPLFLFVGAGTWPAEAFWASLAINQALAWLLFAATCWLLPRTWQQRSAATQTVGGWSQLWRFGSARRRDQLRRRLLGTNPVLWMMCRERWQAASLWAVVTLLAAGLVAVFFVAPDSVAWLAWSYFANGLTLLLYLGTASVSGRFLVEARRNGMIELLLATPLTARQVIDGQWRAFRRMFGLPLVLCVLVQLLGAALVQERIWSRINRSPGVTATPGPNTTVVIANGTNSTVISTSVFGSPSRVAFTAIGLATATAVAANLVALTWFGMWSGLTSKNLNLAILKTVTFVQILPWFVIGFAAALMVPLLLMPRLMAAGAATPGWMMSWYPALSSAIGTALVVAKDVAFSLWARRRLYREFRSWPGVGPRQTLRP